MMDKFIFLKWKWKSLHYEEEWRNAARALGGWWSPRNMEKVQEKYKGLWIGHLYLRLIPKVQAERRYSY